MMNSLFESFDPMMSLMSLNLIVIFLPILAPFMMKSHMLSSRTYSYNNIMENFMFSELSASLNNSNKKSKIMMLVSIFILILLFNLLGLMPYVYTITSQMMMTFSFALPFWLSFLLFSFFLNTNHLLSHLVPLSTPLPLSQFMTLIESVSQIIRPITLSVRLCANMTAGHILMALASEPIFILNFFSLILIVLLLLETAVAFIQSYVFTMLLSMYLSETI